MVNVLDNVLSEFLALAKIPRPSHHEAQAAAHLCRWAQAHGLPAQTDALGDVIIDKPASVGCEGTPRVILQAHMDMVCVAREGVSYDPLRDGIKVCNDGKTLTAEGTSLGADDGIGVAMALCLLADDTLRHGPLRAIFTTNEENGMDSMHIDAQYLDGAYLINLDWESAGSLCNSCAGGDFFRFSRKADWEHESADSRTISLRLDNLLGGHSGACINQGRANALVILATALSTLRQSGVAFRIADFRGGRAVNAIPHSGQVTFTVAAGDVDKAKAVLEEFTALFREAYDGVENAYTFDVTVEEAAPRRVLGADTGYDLVALLTAAPNNVHTMSPFVEGLVESSSNIGVISVEDDEISFTDFARSSSAYQGAQLGVICRTLAERCGFTFSSGEHVPGWAVNPHSKLVPLTCALYEKLTGKPMVVEPIHAGLECGAFAPKNPALDMIAIGPTLQGVHTPEESCALEDVRTTTELLFAVVEAVAEQTAI